MYRPSLTEGNRAVRGLGFRGAGPVALAVYALLAAGVALAARHRMTEPKGVPLVAIVLQEGPDLPDRTPGPPPSAPARVAHLPAAPPLHAPAPAPMPPPRAAPPALPDPGKLVAPEAVPAALPKEDHSRDYGSNTQGGAGTGESDGQTGGAPGTGGTRAGGEGGRGAQVLTLDLSRIEVKSRPPRPDYPLLAQKTGVQGSVVVPILVGVDGVPLSARAVDGPSLLRSAAEKFALAYRFEPYRVNGVPHPFQFTLTVTFTLKR